MRISDWSSDVCSSDLNQVEGYSFALKLDGETVYTRAAGNVTGTNLPMNLDLAIQIASASKALSAPIILSLFKNVFIDPDTPVSKYIAAQINWPVLKADNTRSEAHRVGKECVRPVSYGWWQHNKKKQHKHN